MTKLGWFSAVLAMIATAIGTGFFPSSAEAREARSTANPCRAANALLSAGDDVAAQKAYEGLLNSPAVPRCAVRGLRRALGGAPPPPEPATCLKADGEFEAGNLGGARRAYVRLGRDSKCAAAGLQSVRSVAFLCAEGKAELASHHKGDALSAFQAALAKNPRTSCALDGVEDASASTASRLLETTADTLPDAGLVAGLLVALLFAVLLLGHFDRIWRALVRVPVLRALIGPRLRVDPLADSALGANLKIGESMSARIRERLQHYQASALDPSQDPNDVDRAGARDAVATLVSGSSSLESALGQVKDVSEHGAFIGALLNLLYALLPVRRLSIGGALDLAPGATLGLQNGTRLAAATTLPIGQNPGSSPRSTSWADYSALVVPAALWAQYEVARALTREAFDRDDPESYVLVQMGLNAASSDEALQHFDEAIRLNPRNWAAVVNKIALTLEGGQTDAVTVARDLADDALNRMTA